MAGIKGSKLMNQKDFDKIKGLLDQAIPVKYVEKIVGRSSYTVRLVLKSKTYADYQATSKNRPRNSKPEEGGGETDLSRLLTTIQAWHMETNSLLNDMKKRLDFIEGNIIIKDRNFLNGR